MKYNVKESDRLKVVESEGYNSVFDKCTGFFARWGENKDDDPEFSPFGNEIADIEITTSCNGVGGKLCPFCYKANTPNGKYMSFETFKKVFDKINSTKILNQIAFGVDSQCKTNPDVWKIMDHCRKNNVIPNVTVAELDDDTSDKLITYVGACAVSRYSNKDICYDTVKKLTDRGLKQCNIHCMVSEETFDVCMETLKDRQADARLSKLNAIVFLSLKQKGRGINHNILSQEKFNLLVEFALKNNIGVGFDSCSGGKFMESIKSHPKVKEFSMMVEPCESTRMSIYINVAGDAFPCSFMDGENGWKEGIDVIGCNDFIKDVWQNKKFLDFRDRVIDCNNCNEGCCHYKI